jgi:hypothetical protein
MHVARASSNHTAECSKVYLEMLFFKKRPFVLSVEAKNMRIGAFIVQLEGV